MKINIAPSLGSFAVGVSALSLSAQCFLATSSFGFLAASPQQLAQQSLLSARLTVPSAARPQSAQVFLKLSSQPAPRLSDSQWSLFASAHAEDFPTQLPDALKEIAITEHLSQQIDINAFNFKDEEGKPFVFSQLFKAGLPVLFAFHYNRCNNICDYLLKGMIKGLKELDWSPGKQFTLATLSIDPTDTPEQTQARKAALLAEYSRDEAKEGWHFLTGEATETKKLALQLGYGYKYDPEEEQYGHSAVIFVLTPEGKISRYLYGIEFRTQDLRMSLLEASKGKIGTVVDRFLLFCFRYDPFARKYSVYLSRLMQLGCGVTFLLFGGYLGYYWLIQKREEPTHV